MDSAWHVDVVKVKDTEIDNPQFKFSLRVAKHPETNCRWPMMCGSRTGRCRWLTMRNSAPLADQVDDATWHNISLKIAEANSHKGEATTHMYRAIGIGIFY